MLHLMVGYMWVGPTISRLLLSAQVECCECTLHRTDHGYLWPFDARGNCGEIVGPGDRITDIDEFHSEIAVVGRGEVPSVASVS